MGHPNYETLVNYVEMQLTGTDQVKVEAHLFQPCEQCNNQIAQLRMVLGVVAQDITVAPPSSVLQQAIAAFQEQPAPPRKSLLRVVAELLFDSRLQLSAMPTRGGAGARQVLFATDQVDIDLNIVSEHQEYNMVGQMLPSGSQMEHDPNNRDHGAFVSLHNETDKYARSTETDSRGQFSFRRIPPGVYDLLIDLGNQEVVITGLEFDND
jgi:hypothetical protein